MTPSHVFYVRVSLNAGLTSSLLAGIMALLLATPLCGHADQSDPPVLQNALINRQGVLPDRINHFHNDALQSKAQDSLSALKQYTSQGSGMTATLLGNLDAEFTFEDSVDSLRAKVSETGMAASIWTNSWRQLAKKYYDDVGVSPPINATTNYFESCAQVHTTQIFLRLSLLKTLAQTYKTLMIGQQILARQTTNSIASLSKQLKSLNATNKVTSTNDVTNTSDLISLKAVENLVVNLVGASQDISSMATNADDQMRSFYLEAAQSKDPAALVELVPMVGSGLDTNSLAMLLDQTTAIRTRLVIAYTNTFCQSNAVEQLKNDPLLMKFWQASWECISNLYPNSGVSVASPCLPPTPQEKTPATAGNYYRKNSLLPESVNRYGLTTDEYEALNIERQYEDMERQYQEYSRGSHQRSGLNLESANFTASISIIWTKISKSLETNGPAQKALVKAGKLDLTSLLEDLSGLSSQIQGSSAGISSSLTETMSFGGNLLNEIAPASGNVTNGILNVSNLLFSTSIWGPSLTNIISGPLIGSNYISANNQKWILGLFGDAVTDANNQQARLVSFIINLATLRGNLRQENLRHYQALNVVVGKEVRRWTGLVWLHDKYSEGFAGNGLSFGNTNLTGLPNSLANFDQKIPSLSADSLILPSIRLLAASAKHYNEKQPSEDESGWLSINANLRLVSAVKLVQGYFLLDAYNLRYALENHAFLAKEMREHEILVDGIVDQSQESEINLILSDQLAFHSTGWTTQDTQHVVDMIQSGFLGWIGYKQ